MKLTYLGQSKDNKKFNDRVAILSFDNSNEELAGRIIDLMEKVTNWTASGFDNFYLINVDDREDFENLMTWYKEVKITLKKCMKFEF